MKKILTIAWRDYKTYFTSPIAYILMFVFLVIMGLSFYNGLITFYNFTQNSRGNFMGGGPRSISDFLRQGLFPMLNLLMLFITPFITMRLLSEERKMHTYELLATAPITLWQIVLGKFLSGLFMVLTLFALTLFYPIFLYVFGNPETGTLVACYLGAILMAACYLSIGTLFSAMTENQIISAAVTFSACFFFWIVSWASYHIGAFWGDILKFLSLHSHFMTMSEGLINTSDVFFFLSFIGFGLYLARQVLESYRWR
ncbi:MAG: ABC transporter permease subunit [Bacteriovoracia bacterium]